MEKKILVLINPFAGNKKAAKKVKKIQKPFIDNGFKIETVITKDIKHLIDSAKHGAKHFTHIAACGGDGTLNAVLNACIHENVTLAFIPAGTINIFAKEFKIPLKPNKAAKAIASGVTTPVDVIKAGDKYALLMVSAGLDSFIVDNVTKNNKKPGKLQYFFETLKYVKKYTYPDIKINANGQTHSAKFIIAGQTNKYAGYFKFLPGAEFHDGLLHVCFFKGKSSLAHLCLAIQSFFGIHSRSPYVETLQTRSISISGPDNLRTQMDGEQYMPLPLNISVVPGKVNFLIPG